NRSPRPIKAEADRGRKSRAERRWPVPQPSGLSIGGLAIWPQRGVGSKSVLPMPGGAGKHQGASTPEKGGSGPLAIDRDRLRAAHRKGPPELAGKGVAERRAVGLVLAAGEPDLALRRRPRPKLGRVGLGKVEGDEEARVLHDIGEPLGVGRDRLGKRQGKIERQQLILVLEPVIGRHAELDLLPRNRGRGEIAEVFEALD